MIDPSIDSYEGGDYELGVSAAASIAATALVAGHPVALFHGDQLISGAPVGSSLEGVLDSLTLINPRQVDTTSLTLASAHHRVNGSSVLVFVTGALEPERLMDLTSRVITRVRVVAVRALTQPSRDPVRVPRLMTINAADLQHFKASWNQTVR